ncbi:divalent metal cation transporter [Flavobacterium sp. W21_SRS_FM6]|uniref:divalent metal cation transporter n=1 Tax=Flavobacterium sp. W21_SRS_FM6 TaxID=3240268 RepID=UPI003F8F9CDA
MLTAIALIGTTIVSYNLLLHASAIKSKWQSSNELNDVRLDTVASISLGDLITIIITSNATASIFGHNLKVEGSIDMAVQLEVLLVRFHRVVWFRVTGSGFTECSGCAISNSL